MALPLFTYPGVNYYKSGNFTLTTGILPDVCVMQIAPQADPIAPVGTLSISLGNDVVQFPNCRLESSTIHRDTRRIVQTVRILDRRWEWKYGEISGRYNVRNSDGTIESGTEKTPRELAAVLLAAMGEFDYDVSLLPNNARPEIAWDVANPAVELARLTRALGCKIVLRTDNRVALSPTGAQAELPLGYYTAYSEGIAAESVPDIVKVYAGSTIIQSKLKLRAVGIETDGTLKPIDELSYKPDDGWGTPGRFEGIGNETHRHLAIESVYRMYEVESQADGTDEVIDWGEIKPEDMEFQPRLLDNYTDQLGKVRDRLPIVEGKYASQVENPSDENNSHAVWSKGFTFHEDIGLFHLNAPAAKSNGSVGYDAAELYATVAYKVEGEHGIPVRESQERVLNVGDNIHAEKVESLYRTHVVSYDEDAITQESSTSNLGTLLNALEAVIDAIIHEHGFLQSKSVEYSGVQNISPSGAIRQVTWLAPMMRTRVSVNVEHDYAIPSERQKRRIYESDTVR